MARRTYDQYCPLAYGLDVIGDRWTPLVIRELLLGPARYSDIARGLPGVATDILTRRLRDLEEAGVVTRRQLPPPAGSVVYELTERGERLREPLFALARWGLELLPLPPDPAVFTPGLLANALQVLLRPGPEDRLELGLVVDGAEFGASVAGGTAVVRRGLPERPELTIRGEPVAVVGAIAGDADDPADVELEGDRSALGRLRAMVELPGAVSATGASG